MLQQFLWFISLEFGAYFAGLTAALASFASMLHEWSFLQTAGMNQGNFGFLLIYFASSLLLLNGVHRVSLHSTAVQFPSKFWKNFANCSDAFEWKSLNLKEIYTKNSIQGTAASEFYSDYRFIMKFHNFW